MTDAQPLPPSLTTGSHGTYDWLTTEHGLAVLLQLCPDLVLDKYLAVTSIDSGSYDPDDGEKGAGWESRSGIAYSPRISSVEQLRYGGFDEWYVFNAPVDLGKASLANIFEAPLTPGRVEIFVNHYAFQLHDLDSGTQTLVNLFWKQLEWIQPESYIADGSGCSTFVSNNKELFRTLREALSKIPGLKR
jgi:hypothetical protein